MMDTVANLFYVLWWYYLLPGIGVSLATWLTEVVMISKSLPSLEGRPPNLSALLLGFMMTLWKWPLLFIGTAAAYLKGNTLLTTFVLIDKAKAKVAKDIEAGLIPLRRRWVQRKGSEGNVFYSYVSDYQGPVPESRATHLIMHPKGQKVFAVRCMPGDQSSQPFGIFNGPWEAKWTCEKDTEWLNVASPLKDQEREALYKQMIERYQHGV